MKYIQMNEAATEQFWYTEYTEGTLTIANAPMDFKAAVQFGIDTYKLHDRNIQEDYSRHYDFKLD